MSENNRKIFVLGLDGASWDLLNPLMDQGVMPNLQKIVEGGTSGVLRSTIPPYTAPAWVSCVTGVNPGKHGIFGFTLNDSAASERKFIGSNYVRSPKLWHYVNAAGKTAGMINIPVTYPAEPVDGFCVPGFLTPLGKEDFTHPVSIYKDFLKTIGYIINVRIAGIRDFSEETLLKLIDDIRNCTQKRYEAMKALRKAYDPDFFMIVFTCMDKIQHKFWKYLDNRDPMYNTLLAQKARPHLISLYKQVDDIIGKILEDTGNATTLYIVSDHGFGPKKKILYINKWLEKNGFLSVRMLAFIKYRFLLRYMKKMDFSNRNIDVFNNPICKFINADKSTFLGSDPYEQGVYYIGKSNQNGYWEDVIKLKQALKELKDTLTGLPLFDDIYHRDDLFVGNYKDRAPDLILKMKDYGCDLSRGFPLKNKILTTVEKPAGCHRPAGIFAAYGDNVVGGKKINASIIDVVPTVLYDIGIPVSKEMDGRVLTELFSSSFQSRQKIEYSSAVPNPVAGKDQNAGYSNSDQEEIAGRLRDLGYLD
ncbi:MAG: hypothetical protein DRH21_02925 [Deltaproteobacteria bacterium]|nr:MAG: hypothetical protein DRH21_02925 [Deltaproteobacteria bacterium]